MSNRLLYCFTGEYLFSYDYGINLIGLGENLFVIAGNPGKKFDGICILDLTCSNKSENIKFCLWQIIIALKNY